MDSYLFRILRDPYSAVVSYYYHTVHFPRLVFISWPNSPSARNQPQAHSLVLTPTILLEDNVDIQFRAIRHAGASTARI
jgi:hypothetical protein